MAKPLGTLTEIAEAITQTDAAKARIREINEAAEAKKQEVLGSIPEDYTQTVTDVQEIKREIPQLSNQITELSYSVLSEIKKVTTGEYTSSNGIFASGNYIVNCDIESSKRIVIRISFSETVTDRFTVYFSDDSGEVGRISGVYADTDIEYTTPSNVKHISIYKTGLPANTKAIGTVTEIEDNPESLETRVVEVERNVEVYKDVAITVNNLDETVYGVKNYVDNQKINSDGTLSYNTKFKTSEYIPVSDVAGKVVRYIYGEVEEPTIIVIFDDTKNRIDSAVYIEGQDYRSFTLRNDAAYVRFSYAKDFDGEFAAGTSAPFKTIWKSCRENGIVSKHRKQVYIVETDDAETVIRKMIDAFNTHDCDVYFERATYDLSSEIPYIKTKYGMTHNETPIGNGCRYYFNGSTIKGKYNLDDLPIEPDGTEFYGNLLGCQRVPSSYELYDGILIATDTRYVVHDESSAMEGTFKHIYRNMVLEYRTEKRTETIRKCLGGGTGVSGVIDIEGCTFITDGTDSCASFHGNGKDVVGSEFNINIRNSWFSNNFRGGALAEHQTARLFFTGNSVKTPLARYDRWTIVDFMNEIRTS